MMGVYDGRGEDEHDKGPPTADLANTNASTQWAFHASETFWRAFGQG